MGWEKNKITFPESNRAGLFAILHGNSNACFFVRVYACACVRVHNFSLYFARIENTISKCLRRSLRTVRSARPKAWSASSAQPLPAGCVCTNPTASPPTLNSNTFLHNAIQHLGYFANLFPTTRCLCQNLLEGQDLPVASHFWPSFFFRTIIFKLVFLSKGTKNNKTPFTMWRQTCVK